MLIALAPRARVQCARRSRGRCARHVLWERRRRVRRIRRARLGISGRYGEIGYNTPKLMRRPAGGGTDKLRSHQHEGIPEKSSATAWFASRPMPPLKKSTTRSRRLTSASPTPWACSPSRARPSLRSPRSAWASKTSTPSSRHRPSRRSFRSRWTRRTSSRRSRRRPSPPRPSSAIARSPSSST